MKNSTIKNPKIIGFVNQKGGVGKTTLLINLAIWLANTNKKVMVIDTDTQASSYKVLDKRDSLDEANLANVDFTTAPLSLLDKSIESNREGYDYLLIDTAGNGSYELLTAVGAMDLVVMPCNPTIIALTSMGVLLDAINKTGMKVPHRIVLNGGNKSVNYDDVREVLELGGWTVLKDVISQRISYQRSVIEGKGIVEVLPNNAPDVIEFLAVVNELMEVVNG